MTCLITANGYKVIETLGYSTANLPALCAAAEKARNDGYVVLATVNGEIVADAEGYWDREAMNRPDEFDLACERRYDHLEYSDD
jgi:hypothetical protein